MDKQFSSEELGIVMGNYTNERIKKKIIELRELMGGKCANPRCPNSSDDLQFAHVKRTKVRGWGRGRKERYYDVVKHPDCYILLTKYCHKLFDDGELKLADFNKFECENWNDFWIFLDCYLVLYEESLCPCEEARTNEDCENCQDLPHGTLKYWREL